MCDLVGSIEAYANKLNLTLEDIIKMKNEKLWLNFNRSA